MSSYYFIIWIYDNLLIIPLRVFRLFSIFTIVVNNAMNIFMHKCLYFWFVFWNCFQKVKLQSLVGMKNIKTLNQITKLLFRGEYISLNPSLAMREKVCVSLCPRYLYKLGYQSFKGFLTVKWKLIHYYIALSTGEAEKIYIF